FEEEGEDGEDEEFGEDDNVLDDEEEAFKQFLKANGEMGGAWGELDDDDDGEDDEPEDYPWPLDSVDERVRFAEALKFAFASNPGLLQASVNSLDPAIKDAMGRIVPGL